MATETGIEWTNHTFNPWTGCAKVSPGCLNCYAEALDKRQLHEKVTHWGNNAPRRLMSESYWMQPHAWNRAAEREGQRKRVFCASMADVFEDRPDLMEPRARLFHLIGNTPWLDWQLLTKRPQNIARLIPELALPNVWLGTSAEDQTRWDERVPILMDLPATVHFVSAEPLLGQIDMGGLRPEWVIVGGESGPGSRPMEKEWVKSLRDQCWGRSAFFFKQWGGVRKKENGRKLRGKIYSEFPS